MNILNKIKKLFPKKEKYLEMLVLIIFLTFLIIIRRSYHLLFHTSAEFYVCLVSFGLFFIAVHNTGIKANSFVVFLGIGYFFISIIDMFHILIYSGMSVIFEKGNQSMVVQFWISARYLTAFTLLGSTLILLRQFKKIRMNLIFISYLCISTIIILSILYLKIFPACYIVGSGLTRFKIDSELIITAILILIAIIYFKLRKNMDKKLYIYMEGHLIFYVASELLFTSFFSPYDWTNVWSHIIRVISYYFLYKAIIETGLKKPYAALYKEIDKIDNELHILYETTGRILSSLTPREDIAEQCGKVMKFLDCHVFINYLLNSEGTVMHLNACEGIAEEQQRNIEFLPLGAGVCGCAVRDGCRIVAENIQTTEDPRTELVKALGICAYACYPLMVNGKAIGSLSFGTRSRDSFGDQELKLMKTVAESVSVAINRQQNEEKLIRQAEELKAADQNKNEFLGALSHELRNPLATIAAGLSLLEVSEVKGQQEKAKEIMKRQTQQL
ncbi:MAG: MASE3 domain-containing protein, partial [Eubacteriaceae bacterium]